MGLPQEPQMQTTAYVQLQDVDLGPTGIASTKEQRRKPAAEEEDLDFGA